MDFMKVRQMIGVQFPWNRKRVHHSLRFSNPFELQQFRKGRLIRTVRGFNDVTTVGKNHMLDVVFGNSSPVSQIDPWYIGLINNSPTPTLAEGDTLSSHSGWTEFTGYTGNRKAWDDANAASKIKGSNAVSTFVCNTTATVYGIFIASVDTGTSGLLWATGAFDDPVDVVSTDELKVTYGVRL